MKKFVFRLQIVLDRALEEEERVMRELACLRNELLSKEQQIVRINEKRQNLLAMMAQMQQGTFDAQNLHAGYMQLEAWGNDLLELINQRRELMRRVETKQHEAVEAMQKRQVLEKLREKQQSAHRKEEERQEFQTMEESVLPRLARKRMAERAQLEQVP